MFEIELFLSICGRKLRYIYDLFMNREGRVNKIYLGFLFIFLVYFLIVESYRKENKSVE